MTAASLVVIGVDAGHDERAACEHDALQLADRISNVVYVSVHVITEPVPHYAAVIEAAIPPTEDVLGSVAAAIVVADADEPIDQTTPVGRIAADHRARRNGRLIHFPGQHRLRGTIPIAHITTLSAITTVDCLGEQPGPDAVVRTQDFVRPMFRNGTVVLTIQPFDGADQYIPFEQPNPHRCCTNHGHAFITTAVV